MDECASISLIVRPILTSQKALWHRPTDVWYVGLLTTGCIFWYSQRNTNAAVQVQDVIHYVSARTLSGPRPYFPFHATSRSWQPQPENSAHLHN